MNDAQADASQHGNNHFRYHRQINHDPISPFQAKGNEDRCEPVYLIKELAIGKVFFCIDFARDEIDCRLVSPGSEMTIQSIVAKVSLSACKPFCKGRPAEVADLFKWLVPIDRPGLFGPELIALVPGPAAEFQSSFVQGVAVRGRVAEVSLLKTGALSTAVSMSTSINCRGGSGAANRFIPARDPRALQGSAPDNEGPIRTMSVPGRK